MESEPAAHLDQAVVDRIFKEIAGLLLGLRQAAKEDKLRLQKPAPDRRAYNDNLDYDHHIQNHFN